MKSNRSYLTATACALIIVGAAGCSASGKSAAARVGSTTSGSSGGAIQSGVDSGSTGVGSATGGLAIGAPNVANPVPTREVAPALRGRDVISTASLTVEVSKPSSAAHRAAALTLGLGGYVASEVFGDEVPVPVELGTVRKGIAVPPQLADTPRSLTTANSSATLVLRVPTRQFETLLGRLIALGNEISYSRSSEDVTQQVADVQSRVASQEASIGRIRALIARAQTISDISNLEGQLEQRESNLESMKAQQRGLAEQTSLATITVTYQTKDAIAKDHSHRGFIAGLRSGWDKFTSGSRWVIEAIGAILPFALLLGVASIGWLIVRRRHSNASASS